MAALALGAALVVAACGPPPGRGTPPEGAAPGALSPATAIPAEGKLYASNAAPGLRYGWAVAVDEGGAGRAIVGAFGHVYLVERVAGAWREVARFRPTGATSAFGRAVAISGSVAVAGDVQYGSPVAGAGAAYVFERRAGGWVFAGRLTTRGRTATINDRLGTSAAVDAGIVFVGANAVGRPGFVEAYTKVGASWTLKAHIRSPDTTADGFGAALAAGGGRLFVGAPARRRAHVYTPGGTRLATLLPGGGDGKTFGASIAGNGSNAIVGAPTDTPTGGRPKTGGAYVYTETATGTWRQVVRLAPTPLPIRGTSFGASVAIGGTRYLVGEPRAGGSLGAVHLYERTPPGPTVRLLRTITASDRAPNDYFGQAVALDRKGAILAGAWGRGDRGASAGAVYTYGAAAVDLVVTSFSVTRSGAVTTIAGEVCSRGAASSTTLRLYLHRGTAPGCNTPGFDAEVTLPLKLGECLAFSVPVTGLPLGAFTAYLQADATCTLAEADEANNVRASSYSSRDISVRSFTAAVSGGMVTLAGVLCHAGAATGPVKVSLWGNLAVPPTCATTGADLEAMVDLPDGGCLSFSLPAALPGGTYRTAILLDSDCALRGDVNRANDAASVTYTIP